MTIALCLALFGCHGGGDGGSGGGGGGAPGGPPGQAAPGAPVAPDGRHDQGGAPGAPYKIPATVQFGGVTLDDVTWNELLPYFWAACPGHSHCVDPERDFRDSVQKPPCVFDHVEPAVGTSVPYGTKILVVGKPCAPDGGASPGDSPGESPGGGSASPDAGDSSAP